MSQASPITKGQLRKWLENSGLDDDAPVIVSHTYDAAAVFEIIEAYPTPEAFHVNVVEPNSHDFVRKEVRR